MMFHALKTRVYYDIFVTCADLFLILFLSLVYRLCTSYHFCKLGCAKADAEDPDTGYYHVDQARVGRQQRRVGHQD